jgi:hypothetical protein
MSGQVVETRPPVTTTLPAETAQKAGGHPGRPDLEAVVFPRDPNRLDARPADHRRRKAAARYAEDGGTSESGAYEPQAPVREERHRRG